MSGSKRQLVAVPLFACRLLIGARTVRAFGVENLQDDPKRKMQVSTLPLDTMNGLELLDIGEKGRSPDENSVGGRQLSWSLRRAACQRRGPGWDGERWPGFRDHQGITSKKAPLKPKLPISPATGPS
jgi:hypothetical protein